MLLRPACEVGISFASSAPTGQATFPAAAIPVPSCVCRGKRQWAGSPTVGAAGEASHGAKGSFPSPPSASALPRPWCKHETAAVPLFLSSVVFQLLDLERSALHCVTHSSFHVWSSCGCRLRPVESPWQERFANPSSRRVLNQHDCTSTSITE